MNPDLKEIIKKSLQASISYDAFTELMTRLSQNEHTTGAEKTEALVNYTKLNDRRVKRWNKTIKIDDEKRETIRQIDQSLIFLVITESWCGDGAHVLPVINKVAESNPNIDLKIVFRDEHPELMNNFLTNGSRSIAKLIILDSNTLEVLNTFGPRPSEATKLVNDYKAEHGSLTPEFKEDLQRWYNKDKGQTTVHDIIKLLQQVPV